MQSLSRRDNIRRQLLRLESRLAKLGVEITETWQKPNLPGAAERLDLYLLKSVELARAHEQMVRQWRACSGQSSGRTFASSTAAGTTDQYR
jgi:hypothetical protein